MRDRDLYSKMLGISAPWHVTDVILDMPAGKVEVVVEHRGGACCPKCGRTCPGKDIRRRRWRHLDTCQFETHLVADVPRVACEEHGVVQVAVPWAEAGSRFTALFESLAIDWLKEESFSAVDACFPVIPASRREPVEAVNTVRKQEGRSLLKEGDRTLTGTKYLWLESPRRMGGERR